MLLGLGVDDLFVIVNCIDMTPIDWTADKRFRAGLRHAGPSITITSVTDALAFFLGSLTTIPALSSFCIFAGYCTIALYLSFLTVFLSWYISDLRRMHNRKGDCCGLCCCKEDALVCCKGYFLTKKQMQFSGGTTDATAEDDSNEFASRIEKFFAVWFAPKIVT